MIAISGQTVRSRAAPMIGATTAPNPICRLPVSPAASMFQDSGTSSETKDSRCPDSRNHRRASGSCDGS